MKILLSTKDGQSEKVRDFSYCYEGELLILQTLICDERCGCERSMVGVETRMATTTMVVSEGNLDRIREKYRRYYMESGWARYFRWSNKDIDEKVNSVIKTISDKIDRFDVGDVLSTFNYDFYLGVSGVFI